MVKVRPGYEPESSQIDNGDHCRAVKAAGVRSKPIIFDCHRG